MSAQKKKKALDPAQRQAELDLGLVEKVRRELPLVRSALASASVF